VPEPLRLAVVGQAAHVRHCALEAPAGGLEPHFVDVPAATAPDALNHRLRALAPDVVVAFRPELLPPEVFAGLDAVVAGWTTEPPETLKPFPHEAYDRLVGVEPAAGPTVAPFWRALPLPVADSCLAPVRPVRGRPRLVFAGVANARRDRWLDPVKHRFDLLHVAHGLSGENLRELLARSDVAVDLRGETYPRLEHRRGLFCAAGLLLVAERGSALHGLRPGIDFVEVGEDWELVETCARIVREPNAFAAIRRSGRRRAERLRASRFWPAFVADLLADVAAFGRGTAQTANGSSSAISASRGAAASRSEKSISSRATGQAMPTSGSSKAIPRSTSAE
jgi:hypothetical protein